MRALLLSLSLIATLFTMSLSLGACASSKKGSALTAADSAAIAAAVNAKLDSIKFAEEQAYAPNVDAAH